MRLAQLEQGAGLDLADPFAGDAHLLADFREGAGRVVFEAEAQADDAGLAAAELFQQGHQIGAQLGPGEHLLGGRVMVFEQIAQVAILTLADGAIEGDCLGLALHDQSHRVLADAQFKGQLGQAGAASQAQREFPLGPLQPVQFFGDVYRQANRSALAGDRPGDSLANPPIGVGAEAEAPGGVEALDRPFQAQGAFLHQIQQLQAPLLVFLGHRHHQPQVGLDHALLGAPSLVQGQTQFTGLEAAVLGQLVDHELRERLAPIGAALLGQQVFAPLHQPGQGYFFFRGQQLDLADVPQVLPHQVGGEGWGQRIRPWLSPMCSAAETLAENHWFDLGIRAVSVHISLCPYQYP